MIRTHALPTPSLCSSPAADPRRKCNDKGNKKKKEALQTNAIKSSVNEISRHFLFSSSSSSYSHSLFLTFGPFPSPFSGPPTERIVSEYLTSNYCNMLEPSFCSIKRVIIIIPPRRAAFPRSFEMCVCVCVRVGEVCGVV